MCNGSPSTAEKISPRVGLELRTARSVGQRLTDLATGDPKYPKSKLSKKSTGQGRVSYYDNWSVFSTSKRLPVVMLHFSPCSITFALLD